jgi:aldose 1-epimerase
MKITREDLYPSIYAIRVRFADEAMIEFLNIGAAITRWNTADGTALVAGYQDYRDYTRGGMYLGATVGLTAGRIAKGQCTVKGKAYVFPSRAKNYLHGGDRGLSFAVFDCESIEEKDEEAVVTFKTDYHHDVMPGIVTVRVRYTVRPGYLKTEFFAIATETALVNLTNHSYFNLSGNPTRDLSDHELRLRSSAVVLVDEEILGKEILPVDKTLFDFRSSKPVMPAITDPFLKGQNAFGIDHLFLLDQELPGPDLVLSSTTTGKKLAVSTSYPAITIYTTNYPVKKNLQNGTPPALHSAIAIEPQFPSNGINDPRFFNLILEPGVPYHHFIEYRLLE